MPLRDELICAVRSLRKSPGLVAVIVLMLALGIGVNATAFNLFNLLVLAPPTATHAEQLLRMEPGNSNLISYANYHDLPSNPAFSGVALAGPTRLNWRVGDGVEPVQALVVSANYFHLAGAPAWLGRTFTEQDARPEVAPYVVVVSYQFWHDRLNSDPAVLGRTLGLSGRTFTVIGVMPKGYRAVQANLNTHLYVPISPTVGPDLNSRQAMGYTLIGRLAKGVGREQARAAFLSMAKILEQRFPRENARFGEQVFLFPVSGLASLQGRTPHPERYIGLAAPFVVAGLLLLIACANVAGVMLARGSMRQREIAIRLALGANRGRVVRLLLADSFLVALLGAVGAIALTAWLTPLLAQIQIPNSPSLPPFELQMDLRMVLYMFGVVIVTTVFCGLMPARQAGRPEILPALRKSALQGRGGSGARRVLVGGQVAASALLLVVCLAFLRSLQFIGSVNPGFDIDHGITALVTPEQKNPTTAQTSALAEALVERVKVLPGVQAASFATLIPLGGDSMATGAQLKDRADFRSPMILFTNVGPAYFQTMGIGVMAGREFQSTDRLGAPPVVVVNQTFARQFYSRESVLGKVIRLRMGDNEPWREVVGVVADNKYEFYGEAPQPQVFLPFLQVGGRVFLQIRTGGAPEASLGAVRRVIAESDKSLSADVRTTRDAASLEFVLRRLSSMLLAGMGGLGVLLSMIGLYGVVSWDVSRRMAEIGVRMALGASPGSVRAMVMRTALAPVTIGAAVGISAAMLAILPLRTFLAGGDGVDPWTIATVVTLLTAVGVAASWFPARKATKVDPIAALRYE